MFFNICVLFNCRIVIFHCFPHSIPPTSPVGESADVEPADMESQFYFCVIQIFLFIKVIYMSFVKTLGKEREVQNLHSEIATVGGWALWLTPVISALC